MKSFKEIVNFVIDHGTGFMHYHEGVSFEVYWRLKKDDNTSISVHADYRYGFDELEITVVVFEKDKDCYVYTLGEDYCELVKKINELEIIP